MKDTKRALRRHHRQRMIARARLVRVLRMSLTWADPDVEDWARRNYNHLKSAPVGCAATSESGLAQRFKNAA